MRTLLQFALGLAVSWVAVSTVHAADPPKKVNAVVMSSTHAKDSQGETVYAEQGPSDPAAAAVSGAFVRPEALAQYKSMVGEHTQFNFGGLVEVEGVVTANGDVIDVQLAKGDPNSTLAKKALAALSQSRFKPATLDGKPVAMLLQVKFRYGLFNSL
jgi:TonB family protein